MSKAQQLWEYLKIHNKCTLTTKISLEEKDSIIKKMVNIKHRDKGYKTLLNKRGEYATLENFYDTEECKLTFVLNVKAIKRFVGI